MNIVCAVLIWYTGHGERDTGNWVFKDGCLTFEDIYDLYNESFKGRYLYVVADCCYSGAWVVECARLLDTDGIRCNHMVERKKVYIKVFAACLPNEQAYDKFYSQCKGVKLHSHSDYSKTIKFAEHRRLYDKNKDKTQTTLGVDFTQKDICILDGDGMCIHYTSWTEHVQRLLEQSTSRDYLI